jgi:hypothetical protein
VLAHPQNATVFPHNFTVNPKFLSPSSTLIGVDPVGYIYVSMDNIVL